MAINLGDINFGLGPDTRRLDAARSAVIRFGQAVDQSARATGEGARATEAAMRRQEKAMVSTLNTITKLNDQIRRTGDSPAQLNRTTAAFNRLVTEMAQGRVSALQFQRSMEDVQTSLGRVNRAQAQHRDAVRQTARAEMEAAKAAQAQEAYVIRVEKALGAATRQVEQYNAQVKRMNAPASIIGKNNAALGGLKGALGGAPLDPIAFNKASQQFQSAMNKNSIALKSFQKLGEDTRLTAFMDRLANVSVLLTGPLGGIAARLSVLSTVASKVSVGMAALVGGVAIAGFAFLKMGEMAVDSAKRIQKIEMALTSVTGSAEEAASQLKYLRDISDRSGTGFEQTATSFVRLEAAAKGTNLEGERTRKIFENITFAAAKLGLSSDEVGGSLRAIEQIMSKGTVQAEELRGQLGDRIPGAFQVMADALGITTKKLGELMKQGQITSDALVPFADTLAKKFGVDVSKSIDTVVSQENRLGNSFLFLGQALDKAIGFSAAYSTTLKELTNIINATATAIDVIATFFNKGYGPAMQLSGAIGENGKALKIAASASSIFRKELTGQITLQRNAARAALTEASAQLQAAKAKQSAAQAQMDSPDLLTALGGMFQDMYASTNISPAQDKLEATRLQLKALDDQLIAIQKISASIKDDSTPIDPFGGGKDDTQAQVTAKAKAVREAMQEIQKIKTDYATLFMSPEQAAYSSMQQKINEQVSAYHDKLVDAKLPLASINDLTKQYLETVTLLEQKSFQMQYLPDFWKALGDTLGESLGPASDQIIDTWIAGGDALKALADIGRTVVGDLIKQFARLAVINPILNMLGLGGGQLQPTFNPLSFLGGGSSNLLGNTSTYTAGFGSYGSFAGGGNFVVGGKTPQRSGMDQQLVSFWGKPGEEVSVGKTGHGMSSGGAYYEGNTYTIDARGASDGVEQKIIAALQQYDQASMARQQKNNVKGKFYRKAGMK